MYIHETPSQYNSYHVITTVNACTLLIWSVEGHTTLCIHCDELAQVSCVATQVVLYSYS